MGGCRAVLVVLGVAGFLLCPGCGTTYTDPESGLEAHYAWETLKSEVDRDIAEVYAAARQAVEILDLRVLRCQQDGIAGEIMALDANVETVNIRLEALPERRTLLMIRIGLFGNQNKSAVLFTYIARQLGAVEAMDEP